MALGAPPWFVPTYVNTVPKGGWSTYTGPWEDGPGIFVNPINSTNAVRYSGQDQTKTINSAYLPPPTSPAKCVLPGAAVGMSKIP